jgi:hypothetical protein
MDSYHFRMTATIGWRVATGIMRQVKRLQPAPKLLRDHRKIHGDWHSFLAHADDLKLHVGVDGRICL